MNTCLPFDPKVSTLITEAVPTLPDELTKIITGYAAEIDYKSLYLGQIKFHDDGDVINPDARNAFKEAFLSSYCSSQIKTFQLQFVFHEAYQAIFIKQHFLKNEMRKIFQEIADSDYRANLDGLRLTNMTLSNLNWSRVSLVGAEFTNVTLNNVMLKEADMTGMKCSAGEWIDVDLEKAQLKNVDLQPLKLLQRVNFNGATGVTDEQLSQLKIMA